jgi:hypothetical protein
MTKKFRVKGLKTFAVTLSRELKDYATFYVQAPDDESIREMPIAELDVIPIGWSSDDYVCSISHIAEAQHLRRWGGEKLSGVIINGKLFELSTDIDTIKKEVIQHQNKPLPGQLGIPGITNDIPVKNDKKI